MEFNLSTYLKKFEQFLPRESRVKNVVIQAVKEVIGITLERSKIAVARGDVFISGSSALRSEINMKQGKILARIKELDSELLITKLQ
jgi:hypothetical protein